MIIMYIIDLVGKTEIHILQTGLTMLIALIIAHMLRIVTQFTLY